MDYLKSEHLKFKRTISNKLIFIVPLITAIFAWLMGGYIGYQYMTLYWWYAFLLPLALLISISNIIAPATAVYSLLHSITGSIGIILASVWQIPLCLYLARKTGMFVPIVLNTILGIVLSTATALGNTIAWWFVPYCWAAKLAEPLIGIEMNGTYAGNCGFSIAIMISISLSILLFLILSYADAKDFSKGR